MTRFPVMAPADTDLLCEGCGYVLNGLPTTTRCPECGKPVVESIDTNLRTPSRWDENRSKGFLQTAWQILISPTAFYRTVLTRAPLENSRAFANRCWMTSSMLLGLALWAHADWFRRIGGTSVSPWLIPFIVGAIYVLLVFTTRLAARLTAWEAAYRGIRLPLNVVLRALHFHAVHYVLVAMMVFATIAGYLVAKHLNPPAADSIAPAYLWTLAGEVVVAAAYLFHTYWIGMRNIMYANR